MKRCETCHILTDAAQSVCPEDGQPLVEDTLAAKLQEALGAKYTLTKLIGKGAMGAVYRARHRDLDDVAIKVMLGPPGDTKLSERFLREARALRKLRHQHTVTVYDLDRSVPGLTYMVMEMVEGHSLREDLRQRGRLTLEEVVDVAEAVCDALQAAHERGIIHRDLKPDNILRAQEETVSGHILRTIKIADFGIVKLKGSQQGGDASMQLTQYGAPIGTPFYMSPEQWFGEGSGIRGLDGRTDIYALGCTLYELLAGRTPFVGRTTSEMRRHHLEAVPPPLTDFAPEVPEQVSRAILRALEKDRDDRPQTAAEFAAELRRAYNESYLVTARSTHDGLRQTQEMISGELDANRNAPSQPSTKDAMAAAEARRAEELRRAAELQQQLAQQQAAARTTEEVPPAAQSPEVLQTPTPTPTLPPQLQAPHRTQESPQAEEARIAAEAHRTTEESLQESIVGYQAADLASSWVAATQSDEVAEAEDTNGEITIVPTSAQARADWLERTGSGQTMAQPTAQSTAQSTASVAAPAQAKRRAKGRWARLSMVGLLLVAIGGGLAYLGVSIYHHYTDTEQKQEEPPAPGMLQPVAKDAVILNLTTGTLRLTAPAGSEVFIDDAKAGVVGANKDFTTQAATGLRNVRVTLNGYRPWYKDVKVASTWTQPVTVELKRPVAASDAATPEDRLKRGDSFLRAKRYDEAEAEFRELLKEDGDDVEAHLKLAATYRAQGRYGEAITEYDTASRLDPRDAETLLTLGTLYGIKEHDDAAEATLRSALKLTPRNAVAHHALARVLLRREGKLDEALNEIEQALKLKADDPNFLDTKALILLARNALNDALKTEQRAIQFNKSSRELKFKAGISAILYRMGQQEEAARGYREIRQTDTNDEWDDPKRLGMLRGYNKAVLEIFAALIAKTN
ncbi:MAG TPA: protein kinase [Pyrinomonadaceae bacterium]|nr:protein kinase [Pyrinomonadaceae bacterium]